MQPLVVDGGLKVMNGGIVLANAEGKCPSCGCGEGQHECCTPTDGNLYPACLIDQEATGFTANTQSSGEHIIESGSGSNATTATYTFSHSGSQTGSFFEPYFGCRRAFELRNDREMQGVFVEESGEGSQYTYNALDSFSLSINPEAESHFYAGFPFWRGSSPPRASVSVWFRPVSINREVAKWHIEGSASEGLFIDELVPYSPEQTSFNFTNNHVIDGVVFLESSLGITINATPCFSSVQFQMSHSRVGPAYAVTTSLSGSMTLTTPALLPCPDNIKALNELVALP